jgi:hypothetical protein
VPVAADGSLALAVSSWDAGRPELRAGAVGAEFRTGAGSSNLLVLSVAYREPLAFPPRGEVEARLAGTVRSWRAGPQVDATTGRGGTRSCAARSR